MCRIDSSDNKSNGDNTVFIIDIASNLFIIEFGLLASISADEHLN